MVIKKEDVKGPLAGQTAVTVGEAKNGFVDCSGKGCQKRSKRSPQVRKKRRHWTVVV